MQSEPDLGQDSPNKSRSPHDLTEGPISQHLVAMTLPMTIGIFAVIAFNVADTLFVSQLGTLPLAAMGLTFPVVMGLGSLTIGLGVGVSSVISRASGQGDRERVRTLTTHSLLLGLLIVSCLILIGMLTIDPLFRTLGATTEQLPLVRQYMQVWYIGMIFLVIPMLGNSAIRAIGDAKFPAMVMVFAGVVNVILDPIFIFGWFGAPRLELQGAALATVASRMLTFGASLWVLHRRERLIRWEWPRWQELWASWKEILYIGLPSAGNQVVGPLSLGIITSLLSVYGATTLAAFAVVTRIESFSMIGIFATSAGLAPIIGQNWGANKHQRVNKATAIAYTFALLYGALSAVLLVLFSTPLIGAFNNKPEVLQVAQSYLWLVPCSYGAMGVFLITNSTFNAAGRPIPSSLLTIGRAFVLYVPLAWVGRALFQEQGVFGALALANVCAGVAGFVWMRKALWSVTHATEGQEKAS